MQMTRGSDTTSNVLTGDIHALNAESFFVLIYKQHMLQKLKSKLTTIHIDATCSVVRKVGGNGTLSRYCQAVVAEDGKMG